jgi:predicted hydrolase (HD superfamily)
VSVLSRFELFVIVRNQVDDRRRLRRSLAIEATMEELAARAGEDAAIWGLAGLGADVDCQLCEHNPAKRGHTAAELLAAEGAPEEVAAAARDRLHRPAGEMSRLAAALFAAEAIVDDVYGAIEAGDPLDSLEAMAVSRRLGRAAERRGDEEAKKALECLARVGIAVDDAAELAIAAMKRVREDLRL